MYFKDFLKTNIYIQIKYVLIIYIKNNIYDNIL